MRGWTGIEHLFYHFWALRKKWDVCVKRVHHCALSIVHCSLFTGVFCKIMNSEQWIMHNLYSLI